MDNYVTKAGETILDVSMNATGSPFNIDLILEANGIDTWTPTLVAGTVLTIPDTVTLSPNNLRILQQYPVADAGFISDEQLQSLLNELDSENKYEYVLTADEYVLPASGGTATLTGTLYTYDSSGDLIDTQTIVPTLVGSAAGFSINGATVIAQNRSTSLGGSRSIQITSNYEINNNGMAIIKTATLNLTQEANAIESYGDWQISASASVQTISAGGGTSKVSASATRKRTYTSGASDTESGTPTYSWANGTTGYPGFSLDKLTGTVTASNRRTTVGNARTCTVRCTMGSTTYDVTITQEANQITNTSYSIGLGATTGTTPETALPASGGTTNLAISGNIQYTYTSGSQSSGSFEPTVSIKEGPSSESGFGVLNGVVTALSMGTTEYPDGRTATVVASGNGVTKELTIYQAENIKTLESITAGTNPAWTETAAGETAQVTVLANYSFTSGSTSQESKTNFTITNSSAGWLTYSGNKVTSANRGTTVGPVRTAALTVSYSE